MGIPIPEALHILRIAGKFSTPVPLAESMLANWLIASTGLPSIGGPLTIAPVHGEDRLALTREGARWRIRGSASRLPWARYAKGMILVAAFSGQEYIALVPSHLFGEIVEGENLAREPRDRVIPLRLCSQKTARLAASLPRSYEPMRLRTLQQNSLIRRMGRWDTHRSTHFTFLRSASGPGATNLVMKRSGREN
jgi:hypothetical protein